MVHPIILHTHPLGEWNQKALPGIIWHQSSSPEVHSCAEEQRLWELVEDPPSFQCTTNEEVIASVPVVAATTVGVQCAGEFRRCEQHSTIPNVLCLQLGDPLLQVAIYVHETSVEIHLHIAVHIETTSLNEENITLCPP